MLSAASKFFTQTVPPLLRQIVPPVIATLVAAVLIAGFNRAFSTHLTQPRLGGLNSEASARPPAKERTMPVPDVATVVPGAPIIVEATAPVREWEKSYEREAAKDQGVTKAAEAPPVKPAEPAVTSAAAQPAQPSGLALARTALRKMDTVEALPAEPQRPVQVAAIPAPVPAPAAAPSPVIAPGPVVVMAPAAPPVAQNPPPVITAEPPMVTVPDRSRRQPEATAIEEQPAPPQSQGPIGMIVDTFKPSSIFAKARAFGEKIESVGNDILPNIRQ